VEHNEGVGHTDKLAEIDIKCFAWNYVNKYTYIHEPRLIKGSQTSKYQLSCGMVRKSQRLYCNPLNFCYSQRIKKACSSTGFKKNGYLALKIEINGTHVKHHIFDI
jgi:hypothetical protein